MDSIFSDIDYLLEKGKYKYLIFVLTDLLKQNEFCWKTLILRCKCYFRLGYYEKSIEDAQKCLTINKNSDTTYIYLAKCFIGLTDIQSAQQILETLLKIDPENSYVNIELEKIKTLSGHFKKALEAKKLSNFNEAIEHIDRCLQYEVCLTGFYFFKVECFIYLKKYKNALAILGNFSLGNYKHPKACFLETICSLYQENNISKSLQKLLNIVHVSEEAQNTYDRYKEVKMNARLGKKMVEEKDYEKAKLYYENVLKLLDVHDINRIKLMHTDLAVINYQLHLYEESIANCLKILENDPNNVKILRQRALTNCALMDYEDALEDINIVIKIHNNKSNRRFKQQLEEKLKKLKSQPLDDYKILGIPTNSTISSVKKAFHTLALLYHPDKNREKHPYIVNKYEKKFRKIKNAYNNLISKQM